ncbi:MAG TPA: AAA family ATPase [Gaiellaceae bacterium]|nr:AAA family ATPase [Gaiellaceae bacterium]
MRCSSCGEDNPAGFRFCGSCGAALIETAPPRETRKVVSVVFCDLSGSTALGDVTDPEALRAQMRRYYDESRAILERHGGTVEKFIGDAVMAVFGVPIAHEDDAVRAVRAAWEMRDAVPRLGLRARIGVNTGEVVAGDGDTLVTGDAVNVAARLEQAAGAGEVLIGAETRRLVRDAVEVEPIEVAAKGKPAPLQAFRLVSVDLEAAPVARRLDTPLVGRRGELEQLRGAFERTVREGSCHLFTVLGVAGVGKSRLTAEFLGGLDATVLHGRCLDYGEGITFWPVISVLKQLGERADGTIARIVEGAPTPNELFWAIREQLEAVALERPLVVFFDDIQWGEETFLDLVDHIADLSRGAPLLLLCLARPELLEKRPGWGGGKLNASTILLEPLTAAECLELIAAHGGAEPDARERILAAAGGNPLFVEEMVALARESGDVRVPGTVQALLQARLDQLDTAERSVIEHGAVEGQLFHRSAVVELGHSDDVEPQLTGLVRKELIRPATATFADDRAFRFRHLLIRDAAYDALPKETRSELHERFADWLARHGHELIELDEVLGYHLEQAARYRRELGRPDAELERRAGRALVAAGARATVRTDAPGAVNLLRRAAQLLPDDDEQRAEILLAELMMLELTGGTDEKLEIIAQLEASDDEALRMHGRIARFTFRLMSDPEFVLEEAQRAVNEAVAVFEAAGDHLGATSAYHLSALTAWLQSLARATLSALERGFEHARHLNLTGPLDRYSIHMLGPLIYGPFTADEVRAHLETLRAIDSATSRYVVLLTEGFLAAKVGRFDEAVERSDRACELAANLGLHTMEIFGRWQIVHMLRMAERFDEAEASQRWVVERLGAQGQASFRSTALIELAEIRYQRGDVDDAERLVAEGQATGAEEDVVNFAYGQGLLARIAADRGDVEGGESLARAALELALRTDFPSVHAGAHAALAQVLAAAGRKEEARVEYERSLELWERYGFEPDARRVRARLAASTI